MINVAINVVKWNFFRRLCSEQPDFWVSPRGCQWVIHFTPWDYIQAFSSLASILPVSLSFFLLPLFNSCGAEWGSRESHTHTHTEGRATVRLESSWGCGLAGQDFPMPIVNCWLQGDLLCPLDPSPGPWPLAQRLCPLPLLGRSMGSVYVCVVCVNGQSQEGFCYSVISHSATSFNIAARQLLAQGKSSVFKANFPCILRTLPTS